MTNKSQKQLASHPFGVTPKADPKAEIQKFFAQRRQAYAESAFVAFCQNPQALIDWDAKEMAERAVEAADALLDALFFPKKAADVPQGK